MNGSDVETKVRGIHALWKYYRQEQRNFNLKVRKEKKKFKRQRQKRILLMKLTNSKKFWKHSMKLKLVISQGEPTKEINKIRWLAYPI